MLRALLATALLFSILTSATAQCPGPSCKAAAQCPGPSCKMPGRSYEALPRGIGGTLGTAGGYVTGAPTGGYGSVPQGGGYSPGGGYGGVAPGPLGVPQGGGYPNNGVVYQNQPPTQVSNFCFTDYGNCQAVQQVGTHCNCMDENGNYYDGVAQ